MMWAVSTESNGDWGVKNVSQRWYKVAGAHTGFCKEGHDLKEGPPFFKGPFYTAQRVFHATKGPHHTTEDNLVKLYLSLLYSNSSNAFSSLQNYSQTRRKLWLILVTPPKLSDSSKTLCKLALDFFAVSKCVMIKRHSKSLSRTKREREPCQILED